MKDPKIRTFVVFVDEDGDSTDESPVESRALDGLTIPPKTSYFYFYDRYVGEYEDATGLVELRSDRRNASPTHLVGAKVLTREEAIKMMVGEGGSRDEVEAKLKGVKTDKFVMLTKSFSTSHFQCSAGILLPYDETRYIAVQLRAK